MKLFLAGALALLALGCNDGVDPASYTPSPGYPCGPMWIPCSLTRDGGCASSCALGNECGGPNTGCATDKCCDEEPFDPTPSYGGALLPDAGPHNPRLLRVVGPMRRP